jgi:hypothetical protein
MNNKEELHWDEPCSICAGTGKAFGKACVCRIEAVDGLAVVAHDLGEIPPALGIAAQADDASAFKAAVDAMLAAAPVPAAAQEDERQAGRDLNNTPCPKCGRRIGVHTQKDWEECFGVKTPSDEEEEGEQVAPDDGMFSSDWKDGYSVGFQAAKKLFSPAAASSESVNTPELRRLLYTLSCTTGAENKEIERRIIAHIESLIAARVAGAQAASDAVRDAALEEAEEGAEILDDLIKSVEQHGNYSKEGMLVFLNQLKQCVEGTIRALRTTSTPADDSQKGGDDE